MEKYRLCNINTLLIAALFILLSLIVVVFNYYQVQHNELNQLSRGLYTKKIVYFFHHKKKKAAEINWSEIETSDDYTIFSELGSVEKWKLARGSRNLF
ncbi:hypothetical protein ACFTAO_35305 [Paenibacillus rhizoplanae]